MSKTLYIIAGPNGAGKTTASFKVLPNLWKCSEFVNADEIARGLSPFNPEEMALEAGKLQLSRIASLLNSEKSFSIETTLATRLYVRIIQEAHSKGFEVELLFLYLPSSEHAIERVKLRVLSGGHNILPEVIKRRYDLGLFNLFNLYMPIVDRWQIFDNSTSPSAIIALKAETVEVFNPLLFNEIKQKYEQ